MFGKAVLVKAKPAKTVGEALLVKASTGKREIAWSIRAYGKVVLVKPVKTVVRAVEKAVMVEAIKNGF